MSSLAKKIMVCILYTASFTTTFAGEVAEETVQQQSVEVAVNQPQPTYRSQSVEFTDVVGEFNPTLVDDFSEHQPMHIETYRIQEGSPSGMTSALYAVGYLGNNYVILLLHVEENRNAKTTFIDALRYIPESIWQEELDKATNVGRDFPPLEAFSGQDISQILMDGAVIKGGYFKEK